MYWLKMGPLLTYLLTAVPSILTLRYIIPKGRQGRPTLVFKRCFSANARVIIYATYIPPFTFKPGKIG